MRFEILRQRVDRAEARMQRCMDRAKDRRSNLRLLWGKGWTAPRIVIAGLLSGFLIGRAEPMAKIGAARWLQLLGTASTLMASIRAAAASATADAAADAAAEGVAMAEAAAEAAPAHAAAAAKAAVTGEDVGQAPRYTPAPGAGAGAVPRSTAPHPAEAATELSER